MCMQKNIYINMLPKMMKQNIEYLFKDVRI